MKNNLKFKLPCNSDSFYDKIYSALKTTLWITPFLILLTVIIAELNSTKCTISFVDISLLLSILIVCFGALILIVNYLFNETLIIKKDLIIINGAIVDGNKIKQFQFSKINSILWEYEKLPSYGAINHLHLVDSESNKHTIIKGHFTWRTNNAWFSFLKRISVALACPIKREGYALNALLERVGKMEDLHQVIIPSQKIFKTSFLIIALIIVVSAIISANIAVVKYLIIIGVISSSLCTVSFMCGHHLFNKSFDKNKRLDSLEFVGIITTWVPFFTVYIIVSLCFLFVLGKSL